jgi:cell division control protein 6
MDRYSNGSILADVDVLEEEPRPEDTMVREEQMKQIRFCLIPLLGKNSPLNCWVYGEPGTGKTAISRFVLSRFQSEMPLKVVHVNCWEKNTFYGVLDKIITDLRILGPEKPATSQKLEILQKYLRENNLVVILDEIDRPAPTERNAIIYNLCNLPRLGLLYISKSTETIAGLEDRIKSRLNAVLVKFPNYTAAELTDILTRKAERSLVKGTWEQGTLQRVAELADGDARVALHTLKHAAYYAQKESSRKIETPHVLQGWQDTRKINWNHILNKLTEHHVLLYEIIRDKKSMLSTELWSSYLQKCREARVNPISSRTFPDYVNELRDRGLVRIKRVAVKGRVREIEIC